MTDAQAADRYADVLIVAIAPGGAAPSLAAYDINADRAAQMAPAQAGVIDAMLGARRVLFIRSSGADDARERARVLGGEIAGALRSRNIDNARLVAPPDLAAHDILLGATLGDAPGAAPLRLTFDGADDDLTAAKRLGDAVQFARSLANAPPNRLTPTAFAEAARALEALGVECAVLDGEAVRREGLGGVDAVSRGSAEEPRVVVLRWRPSETPDLCIVAAGLTFDAGGLSLKPAPGMEDMGYSKAGPAAALAALRVIAERRSPLSVLIVLALAENLPSGGAMRPGDIVRLKDGRTIELRNADAEVPVLAADAMAYALSVCTPRALIDIGAYSTNIIAALGFEYAGRFSNNAALDDAIARAGAAEGEKTWPMPLDESYDELLRSVHADVMNFPRQQGIFQPPEAITVARLLKPIAKDTPWAHLDISGVAYPRVKPTPTQPVGATGYGVLLLSRLAAEMEARAQRPG